MINCIIFSKNRAMQLDALLDSIEKNCNIFKRINILWTCTPEHSRSYKILRQKYNHNWVHENKFSVDLQALISSKQPYTCFFVDDCIVYRKVEHEIPMPDDFTAFSLRLGLNIKHCRTEPTDKNYVVFNWKKQIKYWSYPFSTDGHIFRTELIKKYNKAHVTNPNRFEKSMQHLKSRVSRQMACFNHSHVVSIPVNLVSNTSGCSFGEKHFRSTKELNKMFLQGKRIDWENMEYNINNCHQELDYKFKTI